MESSHATHKAEKMYAGKNKIFCLKTYEKNWKYFVLF